MGRRRIRVRPNKASAILSLVVGVLFVFMGIFIIVPMFGLFGLIWTLMAVGITAANALPLFSKHKDYNYSREIIIEDDKDYFPDEQYLPDGNTDAEQRLRQLQSLYDQRLITKEEYDAKRAEILGEL